MLHMTSQGENKNNQRTIPTACVLFYWFLKAEISQHCTKSLNLGQKRVIHMVGYSLDYVDRHFLRKYFFVVCLKVE